MRVKEWSNTVILRLLRNEKYCGDLVQKKTYTPDFLSHDKKYNRGQEEFVIIKDHHEPIIPRAMFDEANRILDERSHSQAGKSKHSNRYPFSGKIKCGCCGCSYVARYKSRKDGSRSKSWRCFEANKNGKAHMDSQGNHVGCDGRSLRNEDAVHIMCLVTRSLQYDEEKVVGGLLSIIRSVLALDSTETDVEREKAQIQRIEQQRGRLLDLYMSGDISKEEFTAARSRCDNDIRQRLQVIEGQKTQQTLVRKQGERMQAITDAVREIIAGVEYEDEFYRQLLDKLVVHSPEHIDVYLNLLPFRWHYTIPQASANTDVAMRNISDASVPISVSRPLSSSKGME